MKILLINPPNLEEIALNKGEFNGDLGFQPIPVGLLIIYKALIQANYEVELVNFFDDEYKTWQCIQTYLKNLKDIKFIGITCSSRQRFSINHLIKICGEMLPEADLFLGGPHVSFLQDQYFNRFKNISAILSGEGDDNVVSYIKMRENNQTKEIDGISYKEKTGNIILSKKMGRANDINNIVPIYEGKWLEDFKRVSDLQMHLKNADEDITKKIMAPIICSRGCTGGCFFCSNGAYFNNTQRYYKVEIAFKEITHYYIQGIKYFDFYDDNFTNDRNFVLELCNKIIDQNLNIHWWCSSRVDAVDELMLKKMKQAGCFKISYGVESGSPKVLQYINKRCRIDQIINAFNITHKIGINARATLSLGHAVENESTIIETAQLINQIKPNNIGIFILKIYPGTPLYYTCLNEGLITEDYWFDEKQDLVPFFTYKTTLEQLKKYKDLLIDNIKAKDKIKDGGDFNAGSIHMELKW